MVSEAREIFVKRTVRGKSKTRAALLNAARRGPMLGRCAGQEIQLWNWPPGASARTCKSAEINGLSQAE
jgi:hypothetical protein